MLIRFHLDEHLPTALAKALRRYGYDVSTCQEAGILGSEDGAHLRFAVGAGRVLVTHDDDFLGPLVRSAPHCGVCYCHPDKYSLGELIHALNLVAECCSAEEMYNRVEYL